MASRRSSIFDPGAADLTELPPESWLLRWLSAPGFFAFWIGLILTGFVLGGWSVADFARGVLTWTW